MWIFSYPDLKYQPFWAILTLVGHKTCNIFIKLQITLFSTRRRSLPTVYRISASEGAEQCLISCQWITALFSHTCIILQWRFTLYEINIFFIKFKPLLIDSHIAAVNNPNQFIKKVKLNLTVYISDTICQYWLCFHNFLLQCSQRKYNHHDESYVRALINTVFCSEPYTENRSESVTCKVQTCWGQILSAERLLTAYLYFT